MASKSKISTGYFTPQAARQRKSLVSSSAKKNKDDIGVLPMADFDEDKFKKLLACPIKRKLVLDLITSEKDNIEKFKQKLGKTNTSERSGSPLNNAQKKPPCNSPTMLFRKRALEQLNSNSSSSESRSSSRQSLVSSPIPSTPVNFGTLLRGVIAYVEFGNDEKNRANAVRVLMSTMGANIRDQFTRDVTHVVFKDGSFKTFQKAKLLKIHLVSVLWVEAVRTTGSRVKEKNFPALGNNVYDSNISAVCSQMQKEYEEIIRDELHRSITTGTPMPSQRALIDRRRTMSILNFSQQSQEGVSSHDREVASIMSRRQIMAIPNFVVSSPEISDDNSDVGAVIDGDIISKTKRQDTEVIGISDMELTDVHDFKENIPNTSNSVYNFKTPKINARDENTSPVVTPDLSVYMRRTRLFGTSDFSPERVSSLKILSRNECIVSPSAEIRDVATSGDDLPPVTSSANIDSNSGQNSSAMSALKLSSDVIKGTDKSASTNMSSLRISTSSHDKSNSLSTNLGKCSLNEVPEAIELIDNVTKRKKNNGESKNEDSLIPSLSKQNRRKTIYNKPSVEENAEVEESKKKSRRKTVHASKSTQSEDVIEKSINEINDNMNNVKIDTTKKSRRKTTYVSKSIDHEAPSKDNVTGSDNSKAKSRRQTIHATKNIDDGDLINNSIDYNQDINKEKVISKQSRRKTVHVGKNTDNEDGIESTSVATEKDKKTAEIDINKRKGRRKTIHPSHSKETEYASKTSLDCFSDNVNLTDDVKSRSRRKTLHVTGSSTSDDGIEKSMDNVKTTTLPKHIKRKSVRKTISAVKNTSIEDDTTSNRIRRSKRRCSLPESQNATSKGDSYNSSNSSMDKSKGDSANASEDGKFKTPKKGRRLYNPYTPILDTTCDDEKERQMKRNAIKNRKSKSPEENLVIPTVAQLMTGITVTTKAKDYMNENGINLREILNKETESESDGDKVNSKGKTNRKFKTNPSSDFDDEQKELKEEFLKRSNDDSGKPSPTKKRKSSGPSSSTDSPSPAVKPTGNKIPSVNRNRRKSVRITQKKKLNLSSSSSDCMCMNPFTPALKRRSTLEFQTLAQMSAKRKLRIDKQKHPSIVCTKLHRDDSITFSQIVKKIGGFVVEEEVTEKTTHLVAGEPKRTINMLRAMARGCWILKHEWLLMSLEAGKWLPEEDYEETDFSPAVQKSRLQHHAFGPSYTMDVFQNCGLFYVARGSIPRCSDLRELIRLCKGKVTSIIRNATVIVGGYYKNENTTCLQESWVLDSIQNNRNMPYKKYIISADNKVHL